MLLSLVASRAATDLRPAATPRDSRAAGAHRATSAETGTLSGTAVVASTSRSSSDLDRRDRVARPAALPVSRRLTRAPGSTGVAAVEENGSRRSATSAPRREQATRAMHDAFATAAERRRAAYQPEPSIVLRDPGQSAVALRAPPASIG